MFNLKPKAPTTRSLGPRDRKRYDFDVPGEAHVRKGRLVFYKQGASGQQVKNWLAVELGSIQNVCKQFIAAIRADADTGLSASLSVFDVGDGTLDMPDHASLLLGPDDFLNPKLKWG